MVGPGGGGAGAGGIHPAALPPHHHVAGTASSDTASCAGGVSLSLSGTSPARGGRRASTPQQWVQYYCYEL